MSLEDYKLQLETAHSTSREQIDRANEEIRFINIPGGMWEDWAEHTHGANSNRARMEFDIISDYVNRFIGEWSLNRANVTFTPDDTATTDEDADLLSGLYRADFKDNDGQIAQDNAVGEVAECGFGAFQISTRFEDEEDVENDNQEMYFIPIFNSYSSVIFDPNAKRADKADAKWVVKITVYTKDAYEEAFPGAGPVSVSRPSTRNYFDWNTKDEILVAERYEVKEEVKNVHVYRNLEQNQVESYSEEDVKKIKDELLEDGWEFVRVRKMKIRSVYKVIFNGDDILEKEKRIAGKFLPIIPMYGFRRYVDGIERYRGLVRKLMDAARFFNMNLSRMADGAASSPDSKPIFTDKQVEGMEHYWAEPDGAYRVVRQLEDANGNPIASGPIGYQQPAQVDPNTLTSSEIINRFVLGVTGGAPQEIENPDASGKAITALRSRENLNTQVIKDNIIQSVKHSGLVARSIYSEIMTSQRTRRTLGIDGAQSTVQINGTIMDEESGELITSNVIGKGKFKVDVEVGPQYETQREAAVETLQKALEMVGEDSRYFDPLMAMWMKNISGTGLEELKEFNRIEMLKQGLAKPETDEEKAMLEQLSQQTNPQDELAKAATKQQEAEAENLIASAENKDADTGKKKAETIKILKEVGSNDFLQRRQAQLQ